MGVANESSDIATTLSKHPFSRIATGILATATKDGYKLTQRGIYRAFHNLTEKYPNLFHLTFSVNPDVFYGTNYSGPKRELIYIYNCKKIESLLFHMKLWKVVSVDIHDYITVDTHGVLAELKEDGMSSEDMTFVEQLGKEFREDIEKYNEQYKRL